MDDFGFGVLAAEGGEGMSRIDDETEFVGGILLRVKKRDETLGLFAGSAG